MGREADHHRHISGFIAYEHGEETISIPYAYEDTSGTGRVYRGDEVKFSLETIPGTDYRKATKVTVTRSKRDRQLAEQIQGMFDMGVPRNQGVVETIKGFEADFFISSIHCFFVPLFFKCNGKVKYILL